MIVRRHLTPLFLLLPLLAVSGRAVALEPVMAALIGLAVTEGPAEAQKKAEPPRHWQQFLSPRERAMLERIRLHPVISACVASADRQSPVAAYQVRKLAEFALSVERRMSAAEASPSLAELDYVRAARAYRWCADTNGLAVADASPLERYADDLLRFVVHRINFSDYAALPPSL